MTGTAIFIGYLSLIAGIIALHLWAHLTKPAATMANTLPPAANLARSGVRYDAPVKASSAPERAFPSNR